jgi:predicted deacylase
MRPTIAISIVTVLACIALIGGAMAALKYSHPPVPTAPPPVPIAQGPSYSVIGTSVEGRKIEAYTYGTGATHLVFVGGIHGGYEWNSVLVAYDLKDYLDAHPEAVSKNERVTIILDANPDAVYKAVGKEGRFTESDVPKGDLSSERFNADGVDLNRNFDCKWASTGTWQNKTVSGGSAPFSEPEAKAIRDYALAQKPDAFIFWHSAAGGVYASQCGNGILPKTLELMNTYANASGYSAIKEFTAYEVHGASEDWLASIGIPAITVEFKTHDSVEWNNNLAGSLAVLQEFAGATSTQ